MCVCVCVCVLVCVCLCEDNLYYLYFSFNIRLRLLVKLNCVFASFLLLEEESRENERKGGDRKREAVSGEQETDQERNINRYVVCVCV